MRDIRTYRLLCSQRAHTSKVYIITRRTRRQEESLSANWWLQVVCPTLMYHKRWAVLLITGTRLKIQLIQVDYPLLVIFALRIPSSIKLRFHTNSFTLSPTIKHWDLQLNQCQTGSDSNIINHCHHSSGTANWLNHTFTMSQVEHSMKSSQLRCINTLNSLYGILVSKYAMYACSRDSTVIWVLLDTLSSPIGIVHILKAGVRFFIGNGLQGFL